MKAETARRKEKKKDSGKYKGKTVFSWFTRGFLGSSKILPSLLKIF